MKKFNEFNDQKRHCKDEDYMRIAIKEAEKAKLDGNFGVGAVLVFNTTYFVDSNTVHSEGDRTNHAELNVIKKASALLNRPMDNAILYSTLEPCLMCIMAAHYNGIREVVFGVPDPVNGFVSSHLLVDHEFLCIAHKGGVLLNDCLELIPLEMRTSWELNNG